MPKLRNTDKARDWMDMAEYDLEDAELDLQHGRFPSAVYHAQQASEKACKALLALFGVEAGKTHFSIRAFKGNSVGGEGSTKHFRETRRSFTLCENPRGSEDGAEVWVGDALGGS